MNVTMYARSGKKRWIYFKDLIGAFSEQHFDWINNNCPSHVFDANDVSEWGALMIGIEEAWGAYINISLLMRYGYLDYFDFRVIRVIRGSL